MDRRTGGRYVQEKLDKSCNSTKSLKDIEVLEIDELCTYIKKDQRMEVGYTFILITVDRGAGEIIDFEVGDGSKATHLNLSFRL
ncbi:MAG: Transposase [Candidatus Midichloria mitochondrii]